MHGGGWGAWELGLHYTKWDASGFPILAAGAPDPGAGVVNPALTNAAKGWTAGIKWLANPNTRFLLNVHRTQFDTPVTISTSSPGATATTDDENAVTFRAQFDF